jgi:CheY-like chemotaxis protein
LTRDTHELTFDERRRSGVILVVDSNPRDAENLAGALAGVGFNVEVVYSGEDAIQQIQREQPAIILTYTRMPEVSGWDVLEWIRDSRETCAVPVILITDNPTDEEIFRGFRRCSTCHLTRPIYLNELIRFLDRVMSGSHSPEELERVRDHMMRHFGPQVEWLT